MAGAERVVWKFALDVAEEFELVLPEGAQVLSIGADPAGGMLPVCWASVPADTAPDDLWMGDKDRCVAMTVMCSGTGHPVPGDDPLFIGSVVTRGGFVWHYWLPKISVGDIFSALFGGGKNVPGAGG